MTLLDFIRLLIRQARLLVLVPLVMGATVLLLTRNQPLEYTAQTTVHTGLVSGASVGEGNDRVDYQAVRSAFDNLIGMVEARSTLQTVALRLIARQLAAPDTGRGLQPATRRILDETLPPAMRRVLTAPSVEATQRRLEQALDRRPALRKLVLASRTPFGVRGLRAHLDVHRVGASDLLAIRYTTTDPVLCEQTLTVLLREVMARHERMRQRQMRGVVAFFEGQTQRAEQQLNDRVEQLRRFGIEHEIINYTEQTEAIAQARQQVAHELQEQRMRLKAARRAQDSLRTRLNANLAVVENNDAILRLRQELAATSAAQALRTVPGLRPASAIARTDDPFAANTPDAPPLDSLRARLRQSVQRLSALQHTPGGLDSQSLIDRWLERVLAVTEAGARVEVLEERMAAFRRQYRTLSPLGSELAGIEREVDIAENQYLELLQSLNQARMKYKHREMGSTLRVVDAPFVPDKPEPTNRAMLIVGAAAAGFVFTLAGILAIALLDSTLRTPRRAEQATGLSLGGAYPVIPADVPDDVYNPLRRMLHILDAQLLRAVQAALAEREADDDAPHLVLVMSTRPGEGKTVVARRLSTVLADATHRVHLFLPTPEAAAVSDGEGPGNTANRVTVTRYPADTPMTALTQQIERASQRTAPSGAPDVIVAEVPALIERAMPVSLAARAAALFLVTRADHGWARADADALDALRATTRRDPLLVLNGAPFDALDAQVGDTPRPHSTWRRRIKRWARLELRPPHASLDD
jgi:uncharacterized protein involved in exopolysaccharide biosynthesis